MVELFLDKFNGLDLLVGTFSMFLEQIETKHERHMTRNASELEKYQYSLPENKEKRTEYFGFFLCRIFLLSIRRLFIH